MATKQELKVLVVGLALLSVNLCSGATVTFFEQIPAAQSATDAIEDCYPEWGAAYMDTYVRLTDGLMSKSYFSNYNPQTYIYVLGVPDPEVYVSQVDIWVYAGENNRDALDVDIAFSSNGVSYTEVITGKSDPTYPVGVTNWNLGRFQFDPEETRGMSHISIISRGNSNTPRIGEIDVFTVPENHNYTRSYSVGIPLDQSFTDVVNGMSPTVSLGSYNPNSTLSDATSASLPNTKKYHSIPSAVVTNQWNLGTLKEGTFLDHVDIWAGGYDSQRIPARFGVVVSSDGTTWRDVADTGYRATHNTSNTMLRIDFDRGAITDFSYVGIIDYPGVSAGNHCQIVEMDIFTDAPRGTVLIIVTVHGV